MFQIPTALVELGKARSQGMDLEGFVVGGGKLRPELLLIGEAPGETEAVEGLPFIGRAGDELMQSLASIGLTREDVYMTSPVRSRPYRWGTKQAKDGSTVKRKYNRPPTRAEILAHAPILDYEIANLQPKIIVTLGNTGLQRLLGRQMKVTEWHGQVLEGPIQFLAQLEDQDFQWTEESYRIIPTFHPASVFYRPSHRPTIAADWATIGKYLSEQS